MEVSAKSNSSKIEMSSTKALGALTGLLAAALVVVTMGWIGSCVYLMRRIKQR